MQPISPPPSDPTVRPTSARKVSNVVPQKFHAPEPPLSRPEHYDVATMLLHWTVALLVLLVGLSSFFIGQTHTDPFAIVLRTFHYAAGTLAFVLVLAWFVWRATQEELTDLAAIGTSERRVMSSLNGAIKLLLILVPLTGIFYAFATNGYIDLGFTTIDFDFLLSEQNIVHLGLAHNLLGKALIGLALLHSLYSLYHHFRLRDALLRRMLPWN